MVGFVVILLGMCFLGGLVLIIYSDFGGYLDFAVMEMFWEGSYGSLGYRFRFVRFFGFFSFIFFFEIWGLDVLYFSYGV